MAEPTAVSMRLWQVLIDNGWRVVSPANHWPIPCRDVAAALAALTGVEAVEDGE